MNLITVEEYREFYGIKKPDEDARILSLITMVSALIKAYLGITPSDSSGDVITETLSIDYDTDTIFLNKYPVETIISVSETDRYTVDSTVHVPLAYAADYSLNSADGTLIRKYKPGGFANWPISPSTITVQYIAGSKLLLDNGQVPYDLKLAAILLVNYYREQDWKAKSVNGSSERSVTVTDKQDFPQHIQIILDKYK